MNRLPHRFDLEALAEYEEAARYYAERQAGRVFAGREVRRAPTKVFPYGILYVAEPDHVLILAVAHYSRAPGYWQHRPR